MGATLEELERRVLALEKGQHELQRAQNENTVTLKWLAGTLAQVETLAYDHRERLKRIARWCHRENRERANRAPRSYRARREGIA